MITEDNQFVVCDEPECDEKIKNHAWGRTKAEGWFFARDGSVVNCPKHVPDWYPAWTTRKKGY